MEKTPKELLEEISQIGKTEKLRVQELNAAIEEASVHVRFFPQNAEQLICTSPERSQQEGRCLPLCSSGRGLCGTAPRKKLQEIQRRGVSQRSRCHALEDRIFRNRIRGREATVANVLLAIVLETVRASYQCVRRWLHPARDCAAGSFVTFASGYASGGAAASLEGLTTRGAYWRRCVHRISV